MEAINDALMGTDQVFEYRISGAFERSIAVYTRTSFQNQKSKSEKGA
jgi:hypothetical protein